MSSNSTPSAFTALVLSRLESNYRGYKQVGRGWRAPCPGHSGEGFNLSIGQSDNGRPLFKCHSQNCSEEGILAALGLTWRDIAPDFKPNNALVSVTAVAKRKTERGFATANDALKQYRTSLGKESATYTYRDGGGKPIGSQVRWDSPERGKTFRPIFLIDGEWQQTFPKVRPLYGLERIAKADPNQPMYLVEGEKCAELMWSMGLQATTWPQGSSGAASCDLSPLTVFECVIVPDADEPGAKAAATIRKRLGELPAPPPLIVTLPLPGARENSGDDVEQFIANQHKSDREAAREELHERACIALENCTPRRLPLKKNGTLLELVLSPEFREPPQTLASGWEPFDAAMPCNAIERGTICVLSAPPGCYKTATMLRLAQGFASQGHAVSWLAGEMRPMQLARRTVSQNAGLGLHAIAIGGVLDHQSRIDAAIKRLTPALERIQWVRAPIGFDEISEAADAAPIVCIDYLQKIQHPEPTMPRHEQLEAIMALLAQLCQTHNTVFILASAQSRGSDGERTISTATKGSSGIEYSADALYCATTPSEEDIRHGSFLLEFKCLKQREGQHLALKVPIRQGMIDLSEQERACIHAPK